MQSIWRRISLATKVTAGVSLLVGILGLLGSLLSPVIQSKLGQPVPKAAKATPQPHSAEAKTVTAAPPAENAHHPSSNPRKIVSSAPIHHETRAQNPAPAEPASVVNASAIAETKKDILTRQDTWIAKHPEIVTRYRSGNTGKGEIEQAIRELEIIEGLAADINDHRAEQWCSQQLIELQLIDVGPLHARNRY